MSTLETPHGNIAYKESAGVGPDVLFIHGNSACKEVFDLQLDGESGQRYRMIAFDLPGHGASSDAPEPGNSYHIAAYAEVAMMLLEHLGVRRCAIVGWSLGGHIGIELLTRDLDVAGLLITGTPPVGGAPADMAAGFLPSPHMEFTGREHLSDAEAGAYADETTGVAEDFMRRAVRRTDGQARSIMMAAAAAGRHADQRTLVATSPVPLAVVTGADEPFVNNAYLASLDYANLWEDRIHVIADSGHAPFRDAREEFDPILARFLGAVLSDR
jgi:pimeloyl-ACP methyl ester carboxylesterase